MVDRLAVAATMNQAQYRARGPNGGPIPRQRRRRNQQATSRDTAKVTTPPNTKPGMPKPPHLTPWPAQPAAASLRAMVAGDLGSI